MLEAFEANEIRLLTASQPECIDHIAVSQAFVGDNHISVEEWNHDRTLSDHKGISVSFDGIRTNE